MGLVSWFEVTFAAGIIGIWDIARCYERGTRANSIAQGKNVQFSSWYLRAVCLIAIIRNLHAYGKL